MWEFFKILVLGKAVLLTPGPIDIGKSWTRITPPISLSALNQGARLEVQMNPTADLPSSASDRLKDLNEKYPVGCVTSRMVSDKDVEITLKNESEVASTTVAYLVLTPQAKIPPGERFSRMQIRATCPLYHVTVVWENSSK